jgi:hypothetical protein
MAGLQEVVHRRVDRGEQNQNKNIYGTSTRGCVMIILLARESLAFIAVASFVGMVCQFAFLVG